MINRGFRVRKLVDTGLECEQDRSVPEHRPGLSCGVLIRDLERKNQQLAAEE